MCDPNGHTLAGGLWSKVLRPADAKMNEHIIMYTLLECESCCRTFELWVTEKGARERERGRK